MDRHVHSWTVILYDPNPIGPVESGWICIGSPGSCGMISQLIDGYHMSDRMKPSRHERQLELELDQLGDDSTI